MIGKKINQLATELAPVSTDLTIIGDPISGVSKKITLAQLGAIFSGAVSFYTNLAGFPATGDINVIYCAKDTQKLYLWSGSAYVEVFPSQALLDTYQLRSEKGVSNGYASLDSTGKVPISQLPSSIMEYKGTWNAATNTPTLANGTGDTGDVYICNVAGTVNFGAGPITFAVGDYVIYSGTIWQRSSGAVGTVTSVAASITGNAIGITGSPVTTSGTLAFAFAGTGAQYIKGDGTLATFPNTISQAEKLITEVYNSTGATLTKGTIVYINGGQGNLPTVTKALATGDSTSAQTFGVVQADITNNNNGYVVVAGKLSDLDTQAYTEGTQLYLSATTAGTWTSTKQYAPNHLVYVGIVVRSHPTQGIVEIKIQNGYELDEIHNVAAQTPTNNDGLFWESATSLWKNKSIATVLGYTPQPQLSGTGFVKISGTTISYDNSTYLTTSAAATTYLPMVLSSTANSVDINGQQFSIYGSAGGFTSGRIIVDPVFSAIGYQNAGVFDGLKILTNGNAEFSNSGVTRFFNQVRFDSTLTNGTYTYTLPSATGTIALVGGAGVGTVTSVGLSSATSGVTIGSSPITTSGTITLAIATASGLQNGLLSSSDWTTFNNKQNALTNPVTGTGTTNYLPKFTGTSTIGNSALQDDGVELRYSGADGFRVQGLTSGFLSIYGTTDNYIQFVDAGGAAGYIRYNHTSDAMSFRTNGTDKMFLNSSGNLGLGVNPSAWGSALRVIQGPNSDFVFTSRYPYVLSNAFFDTSWKYVNSEGASFYVQAAGQHQWFNAPSGTAGNAISFTQAMTLNASGNLSIGNTNDTYKLDVSGTGRFTSTISASGATLGTLSSGSDAILNLATNASGSPRAIIYRAATAFIDITNTAGTAVFQLSNGGAATFSSSVTALGVFNGYAGLNGYAGATHNLLIDWSSESQITTLTATNLFFGTNAQRRMTITSGGNVGIGTTSPTDKLNVAGSGNFGITLSNSGNTGSDYNALRFSHASNEKAVIFTNSDNLFLSTASGFLSLQTASAERLRITSGGNVGIGTTSPASYSGYTTLEVAASTGGVFRLKNNAETGVYEMATTSSNTYLKNVTATDMWFGTNNTERMRITSGGNVEVNTGSIKTGEPDTGYGRAAVKIGTRQSGTAFDAGGYIPVSIDGTVYFINLFTSTP